MLMFHITGDVVAEIGAYSRRGTFVLMPEFNPGLMLELIETERCMATLIVAAVILPKDVRNPPSVDHLFQHCRENLSPQKTPALWFCVDQYPMASTGKIQKAELMTLIADKKMLPVEWARPQARSSHA
jgi:hypothetical protein